MSLTAIRHVASGAVHNVSSADGYDLAEWDVVGPLPAGVAPELTRVVGGDVLVDLEPLRDHCRVERNARLTACDWTQLPDSPLPPAKRAEWAAYRQALRDLPETADPLAVAWPEEPTP